MADIISGVTRSQPLHQMFTVVPYRYDLINCIITLGLDKRWRDKAARECLALQLGKVLDLCCGTGDLAIHIACLANDHLELTGIDYSLPMLEIASSKATSTLGVRKPSFVYGDASCLPFADGYFDCVGISFAFRNITYKNPLVQRYLAEVLRVLRVGGRFVIVESSQPKSWLIRKLYHLYLRWFVFRLGFLLSGNRQAYHYLAESASRFYTSQEVEEILVTAGFREVCYRPFLFGVTGIHVAVK
ncbi:ubiquinone/menaquinone biosynthesis methyltransferase [Chloroflexota bacterium]